MSSLHKSINDKIRKRTNYLSFFLVTSLLQGHHKFTLLDKVNRSKPKKYNHDQEQPHKKKLGKVKRRRTFQTSLKEYEMVSKTQKSNSLVQYYVYSLFLQNQNDVKVLPSSKKLLYFPI